MPRKYQPKNHKGRQLRTQQTHKRVLVVHNGKVTEEQYLQKLKQDLYNGVLTVKFHNGSIWALIDKACVLKEACSDDPYNKIYILADVDGKYSDEEITSLREQARSLGIELLLSNPCIEVALSCYAGNVTGASRTIKGAQKEAKDNGLICGKDNKEVVVDNVKNHLAASEHAKQLQTRFTDGCPGTEVFTMIDYFKDSNEFKE